MIIVKDCLENICEKSVSNLESSNRIVEYDITRGLNQSDLQAKITAFLKNEIKLCQSDEDIKNRQEVINYFQSSGGECTGLSVLWSFGRRSADKDRETSQEKDDLAFFNSCHKKLFSWDGKSEFSDTEKADLYRFIGNIRTYQIPFLLSLKGVESPQLDLSTILEDAKRGKPILCFEKDKFICTKKMLHSRLEKIIQPQTMIFIGAKQQSGVGHMMAVYKEKDSSKIYFYNSNARHGLGANFGEMQLDNLERLVDAIWDASDPNSFIAGFSGINPVDIYLRNVSMKVYKFSDDPEHVYPKDDAFNVTSQELMDAFKSAEFLLRRYYKDLQSFIGSLNSLNSERLLKILRG